MAIILVFISLLSHGAKPLQEQDKNGIRISGFDIDITPPLGSLMAYDKAISHGDLGLRARGIILLGAGQPIVLCSFDWLGIGNEANEAIRLALAQAAGTTPERVALHTVHQHDTPACDFGAEKILKDAGFNPGKYDGSFAREVIERLGSAIKNALQNTIPVSYVGFGEAKVLEIASNRRILGTNGLVIANRLSSCGDPLLRAEPEGLIDPMVSVISFWNQNIPVAVLSYYAVHPQSYYRTGVPNPDFPGIARLMRQLAVPQALHIHFNGAGGNIAAGKYNNGAHENRGILAQRLAQGMKSALDSSKRFPVSAISVKWQIEPISLPPATYLKNIQNMPSDSLLVKNYSARLAWFLRCQSGKKINLGCLTLGKIRILHLPGEPFVEYQLAAKAERKDLFVAVAGYGDYGPGYIGTAEAYKQGGYETSYVSGVTSEAENIMMTGIRKLLHKE